MSESASYELNLSRVFNAPCVRVYQAFVDPDQIAQWFGPVGVHVPRESVQIDARPGGYERLLMIGNVDQNDISTLQAEFIEVLPNELLVEALDQTHAQTWPSGHTALRLQFTAHRRKTDLLLRQRPYDLQAEDQARLGWETSFTKLDELLAAR